MTTAAREAALRMLSDILPDIQGIVMRGYNLSTAEPPEPMFARYFTLVVRNKNAAGRFVNGLVDGSIANFQVRSAADWGPKKPATCLNIGFTFRGLNSFGIDEKTLSSPTWFGSPSHAPFMNGSAASKLKIGDVADSDPKTWVVDDQNFDVMLGLWAAQLDTLENASTDLRRLLADGFAAPEEFTSQDLAGGMIYFGYRDGIAQPILDVDPYYKRPDGGQVHVDNGAFVLGAPATTPYFQGVNVPGGCDPPTIGLHGSFAAFRMLRQDVEGYDAFVTAQRAAITSIYGVPDAIADDAMKALMVGRWPANGTPVETYPVQGRQTLPPDLADDQINDFVFATDYGDKCPYGSHIRRTNPRDGFAEDSPSRHRIMRRAIPYQMPYDKDDRNKPTSERGLMGFFIGASMRDSFEFLMETWVNGASQSGLPRPAGGPGADAADPVIGHNLTSGPWNFTVVEPLRKRHSLQLDATPVPGWANFVRTRGSAYVFLPGMAGIKVIAEYAIA